MTAIETKNFNINPSDYLNAIIEGKKFYIQFQRFGPEVEAQIIKIIHRYLEQYDLLFHKDTIISIAKELVNNAIKANLKRIYFESKGLDINNPSHYREGMDSFKDDVFESQDNKTHISLDGSKYVVRITFDASGGNIKINVKNNITILESELKKIKSRINKAYKYNDIAELTPNFT